MDGLMIAHGLNGLLMVAMPLALAAFLAARWKLGGKIWWIGGLVFILSQVGHIPFNALAGLVLNRSPLANWPPDGLRLFNAAFVGLSAGLFEELSRYGMFRWWLKENRSWKQAVVAGAGHGGMEAIILGVLVIASFLQLAALRGADLSTVVPAGQLAAAQSQVAAYWSMSWYTALMGAMERLFTIPVQIALSVLVAQTFLRKQWFWVWLAVLFHALIDGATVFLLPVIGMWGTEALVGGFSILAVILIFLLRMPDPVAEAVVAPPSTAAASYSIRPVEETPDHLEQTRYT